MALPTSPGALLVNLGLKVLQAAQKKNHNNEDEFLQASMRTKLSHDARFYCLRALLASTEVHACHAATYIDKCLQVFHTHAVVVLTPVTHKHS